MQKNNETTTRDKILHIAVELFSNKGFHGTSVRELAKKVGIKESSLYNHFESKQAILSAILQYHEEVFNNSVNAIGQLEFTSLDEVTDPVEFWLQGLNEFLNTLPPLQDSVARILINEMYLNRECRRFYLDILLKSRQKLVATLFRVMHGKGMLKDLDIDKTASQYVYMLQGLEIVNTLHSLEGEKQVDTRAKLIEQITFFIQRLKK